jgi:hypothetical protein
MLFIAAAICCPLVAMPAQRKTPHEHGIFSQESNGAAYITCVLATIALSQQQPLLQGLFVPAN